jgi:hypothetical protein
LSEKLEPVQSDVVRLDFDSFAEPEKQLFRKVWEIQEKYGDSPLAEVIEANKEFISKTTEVIAWRVLELFMFVNRELLGEDEIEDWYFKLHLYNFFADLNECLQRVRKWPVEERERFLRDMKESGMINRGFRFPREPRFEDLKKDGGRNRREANVQS